MKEITIYSLHSKEWDIFEEGKEYTKNILNTKSII